MPRKPELSVTHLVASGLATATAAVGTSFLGVAGTIGGAAFMSVVSTAGAAIGKHYLDESKGQLRPAAWSRTDRRQTTEQVAAVVDVTRTTPTWTVAWPQGRAPQDRDEVAAQEQGELPADAIAGTGTLRTVDWLKRRWVLLGVAAVTIFAVVMGGITLVEAIAKEPVAAIVGGSNRSGTTLGNAFGGDRSGSQQPRPDQPTMQATSQPTRPPATSSAPPATAPAPPGTPAPQPTGEQPGTGTSAQP